MFRKKDLWRSKPGLVNFFCNTNLVRCDKSDNASKISKNINKEEKNNVFGRKRSTLNNPEKKSSSDTGLYSSVSSDVEKTKAKQKLENLIKNMQEARDEKWSERQSSKNKVEIARSSKETKSSKKQLSKLSKSDFEKTLIKSAEVVAGELGGDVTKTKFDLLASLKEFDVVKEARRTDAEAEDAVIQDAKKTQFKSDGVGLQWTQELGIFQNQDQQQESATEVKLKIWDKLGEAELKFLAAASPRNYFEELIMWTEQGKLWRFPIDNHQGMEEEARVDFTEHIFLEDHLEPWCPKSGPLRHFMELVLVGLSKNPFLTVQDKKEHVHWFRDYFERKKKLLQELGAFASTKELAELREKEEKQS